MRLTALPAVLLLAALPATPVRSAAAPALPDTGLFAPVAARWRARLDAAAHGPHGVTPAQLRLLLATGQVRRASDELGGLKGHPREANVLEARVAIALQDYPRARAAIARIAAGPCDREDERAVRFAWRFERNDAPGVDSLSAPAVASREDARHVPELLAAGRLAYERLDFARADSCFARVLGVLPAPAQEPARGSEASAHRALALAGRGLVQQKRRDWDGSLATLREALAADGSAEVLVALTETLIRLGRTDEAISAGQWAVKLAPFGDAGHYLLGNGYARKNYTQLFAAYPGAFADSAGRAALARADAALADGRRDAARAAYAAVVKAHAGWADARVRLASLDFEDGRFADASWGCFEALRLCPEYGRAHAILARTIEAERFTVDVHRPDDEARFAAEAMPDVPGIEKFVLNWKSLSPRHRKRVALSIAPWRNYLPVLIAGGATYDIKPMYQLLSETPDQGTLRDQRIDYDSRLWDDVRGCGGYHTVTGVEDVERTIFGQYNTVLHELTHQVHDVLPADDVREIQELYRRAKERDDATHDGFLSRYAGGSVYEYFAEGANALYSPMRDAYDPREVVRERLERADPDLEALVKRYMARTDVSASYPVAYSAGGDDRVEQGDVAGAVPLYRKALAIQPDNETALLALARALVLGGHAAEAEAVATRAVAGHAASGPARVTLAEAAWHAGQPLAVVRALLAAARPSVRSEDRHLVDLELGRLAWTAGDAAGALAAYDSVLAYQSDDPGGLRGRAEALALAGRDDEAVAQYGRAVRMRTGIADLRCAFARDLLRAGRVDAARAQLAEATLLDERNPEAEALRAWCDLESGDLPGARAHAKQALAWGPWCDLAAIVAGGIEARAGDGRTADALWTPVEARRASQAPPSYVYRPRLATWQQAHALPAVERAILEGFRKR